MENIIAQTDGLNAITLKPDGNIELTCLNPGNRIVHGFGVVAAQKPLDNAKKGFWFQITKVIQ